MAGQVAPVADEREGLTGYLAHQRALIRLTAFGLTDEQARATPTVSPLSVGGLIKHVAVTESSWVDTMLQAPVDVAAGMAEYEASFSLAPEETLGDLFAFYDRVAARTDAAVAEIADLGQAVPIPKGVPWYPDDVEAWSVRWVLLHIIEETARHAGHADIVREAIDGGTAFPLLAAAEGWPSTPWLEPWSPTIVST